MTFISSFGISAAALDSQKLKMDLTTANLANAQTTRGIDGQPYRRAIPVFKSVPVDFQNALQKEMGVQLQSVELDSIQKDNSPLKRVYDPSHPDADQAGYVSLPNINLMEEMADMLIASRAYEANVTAFSTTKSMVLKLIDLGKI